MYIVNTSMCGNQPLYPLCPLWLQVQSNEPSAVYRLVQKERELKFPFSITKEGEIQLMEELDREEKNMVNNTCTH